MAGAREGRVAGKMALITGAAKGIGAGCAAIFAREGARLVLVDTDEPALHETAARLQAGGTEVHPEVADIAEEEQVQRMIRRAEVIAGRLDILVINAAILPLNTIDDTSMEEWDAVMRVNMRGSFLTARHAIAAMRRGGGGSIVVISSISALVGRRGQAAYAPSKAYVHQMARDLALDHARDGIRVNAVCPGTIMSDAVKRLQATMPEGWLQSEIQDHPIGRLGQPEDVGEAVCFLASDQASFITGAYLAVDGGYTAQ